MEKSLWAKTTKCFYSHYPEDGPDSVEEHRAMERYAKGRYTLEEAAFFISGGRKEEAKKILTNISFDVRKNTLPSYYPNSNIKNEFAFNDAVRNFIEEVYWEDLNNWLVENEPRCEVRFPRPDLINGATTHVNRGRPETKKSIEINLILEVLKNNNFDINLLPVGNGKVIGAKKVVWEQVDSKFTSREAFDSRWKQMLKDGCIKNNKA